MQWNGASRCEYDGKSMETEKTTWSEFYNGWATDCGINTSVRRKK